MTPLAFRPAQNDLSLWTQFLDGSVDAWGKLMDHHYRVLFNYGLRFGVDRERVHDCIHDLFLDLWDGRQHLNATVANVSFYLLRAFRHKLIKDRQQQRTYLELNADVAHGQETSVEEWLMDQETTELNGLRLKNLLTTLPTRQQEALYLKYYANLSHKQVAELMDLQPQSVANLLHTALQRLRAQWGSNWALLWLLIFLGDLLAGTFFSE